MDELDQRARTIAIEEFVEAGQAVGIDVVAEILDHGKSAAQVFEIIREKGANVEFADRGSQL